MKKWLMIKLFLVMSLILPVNSSLAQHRMIIHSNSDSLYMPTSMVDSITFMADMGLANNVVKNVLKTDTIKREVVINDTLFNNVVIVDTAYSTVIIGDTVGIPTSYLIGKKLYSIFDSFGSSNVWQTKLTELSGMVFDKEQNKVLSYGGTATAGYLPNCGMKRAQSLLSFADRSSEGYLFIENVNDISWLSNTGTVNDEAWFVGPTINIPIWDIKSYDEALQNWNENFTSIVDTLSPKQGTALVLNYEIESKATKIDVLTKPTRDGSIYIKIGNNRYGIEVNTGMTIENIVDEMMEYSYGGWTIKKKSPHSVIIGYYKETDQEVLIETNNTGVECSLSKNNMLSSFVRYFCSNELSKWSDNSYWVKSPSLYAIWKGFIQYLTTQFPQMHIFLVVPTYYKYDFDSIPVDSNGEVIYTDINNSYRQRALKLFEIQKEVARYYHIPILDMEENSGINIYNASSFYKNNNVHPMKNGYERWAETMYRLLR